METRLNLLCEAGVIDKDICKGMMQVVNVLETECHLPVRSEQGTMAMTHMASALMRSRRGEEIEPLDNELLAEPGADFRRTKPVAAGQDRPGQLGDRRGSDTGKR